MQPSSPIGVFDSGVGGLTVLRAIHQQLPEESLVYLGDTARVPYGTKSAAVVEAYAHKCTEFLVRQGAKAVVIACNTASAVAVESIREEFQVPVVGVIEPGAQVACEATLNGRIGVLGTQGTIQSGAYQAAIEKIRPGSTVIGQACPLLVPLAEEDLISHPAARLFAQDYLAPLLAEQVDTIVLGCTHYPLFKELLQELCGDSTTIVDSAIAVARRVALALADQGIQSQFENSRSTKLFATDWGQRFEQIGERFLRGNVGEVTHVDL